MKNWRILVMMIKYKTTMRGQGMKQVKKTNLLDGEIEVMRGRGSRQTWMYFTTENPEFTLETMTRIHSAIRQGRNQGYPTGITRNNSFLDFDAAWMIEERAI